MRTVFFCMCCICVLKLGAATPQPNDSQQIIITSLNNGDTLRVGQTALIQWVCIDNIVAVDIRLSPDLGKTWILLNGSSIGYMDTASWGHYKWTVKDKIKANAPDTTTFTLTGNHSCLFRVENYSPASKAEISVCAKPVTIIAGNGIIVSGGHAAGKPDFNIRTMLSQSTSLFRGPVAVRFFDSRGRAISVSKATASGLIFGVSSSEARPIHETGKAVFMR